MASQLCSLSNDGRQFLEWITLHVEEITVHLWRSLISSSKQSFWMYCVDTGVALPVVPIEGNNVFFSSPNKWQPLHYYPHSPITFLPVLQSFSFRTELWGKYFDLKQKRLKKGDNYITKWLVTCNFHTITREKQIRNVYKNVVRKLEGKRSTSRKTLI